MASAEEQSEGSGASLLKKEWSQIRDLIREEREAFRAEREQANAALRVERREAAAAQERLRPETENLRASMEQLQRRVEGQSSFARGKPFAGLGSVGGPEERLPARRAAGSDFVPAGFQSPRSSVSGDSGTASAPRFGENTVSGGLSLSDESFPNEGARSACAKPSRSLQEGSAKPSRSASSRRLRGASKAPPRTLRGGLRTLRGGCTYRRLHEDALEGSRGLLEGSVDELHVPTRICVCVLCVCFLLIHSGHQWTYQPGSHRRKVTQDFSSTFFLRCMP